MNSAAIKEYKRACYLKNRDRTLAIERQRRADNFVLRKCRGCNIEFQRGVKKIWCSTCQKERRRLYILDRMKKLWRTSDDHREYNRSFYRADSAALTDRYVKLSIRQNRGWPQGVPIPQKLIEAKRSHLKLVRLLKEKMA